MDWTALTEALAAKYEGLANADASETLRASHATTPDAPVAPCAVTVLAGLGDIAPEGPGWLTGFANVDVMILLAPVPDVPRRYAAMLRWVGPATTAAMSGVMLGMTSSVAGAVPVDVEVALAGDSEVYAGLPWDLVRVRYRIPYRDRVTVTP